MRTVIRKAGMLTFDFAAPILMATSVAFVWVEFGWVAGLATSVGYVLAASLAWRIALKEPRGK